MAYIEDNEGEGASKWYDPTSFLTRNPVYRNGLVAIILGWMSFVLLGGLREFGFKRVALLGLLFATLGVASFPKVVNATEIYHVDVYCVGDEEFMSGTTTIVIVPPLGVSFLYDCPNPSLAESGLNSMAEYFYDNFMIEMHFHYWFTYDSEDSLYYASDRLNEAIDETGWHWGKSVDGEPIELMIAFTQQALSGGGGYSPPWERAFIAHICANILPLLMHEIGHQ
jgi:hypothetical protein